MKMPSDQPNFKKYVPQGSSLSQKVAHCLDWAAVNYPGRYAPHNVLARAVTGHSSLRMSSPQVEAVRNVLAHARAILRETYKRDLHTVRGVGVRATISDEDALKHSYRRAIERSDSANRNVVAASEIIDIKKVETREDTRALKESFVSVTGMAKGLSAKTEELRTKLKLLPANGTAK